MVDLYIFSFKNQYLVNLVILVSLADKVTEDKRVEDETAKRIEEMVARRVEEELEKRRDEIEAEVRSEKSEFSLRHSHHRNLVHCQ